MINSCQIVHPEMMFDKGRNQRMVRQGKEVLEIQLYHHFHYRIHRELTLLERNSNSNMEMAPSVEDDDTSAVTL